LNEKKRKKKNANVVFTLFWSIRYWKKPNRRKMNEKA